MRKLLILPILLVAVLLVGVSPAAAKTRSIKIGDDFFVRSSGVPVVTVKKGTYRIVCTIHSGMRMTLKVK